MEHGLAANLTAKIEEVHATDFEARIEFLTAFERIPAKVSDRPLGTLRLVVLPAYQALAALALEPDYKRSEIARELFSPLADFRENSRVEARHAVAALDGWAATHRFRDDWILEAAHETVREWVSHAASRLTWRLPAPPLVEPPQPTFRAWAYPAESWHTYRMDIEAQCDYLLRIHKADVLQFHQRLQKNKPNRSTAKHALWTALYFAGWSAEKIVTREPSAKGFHRTSVYQAIQAFAKRVGLTLPRRGER